jgi:hypothetical protein
VHVRFLAPRGLDQSGAYQRYYLLGLEEVVPTVWAGPPLGARLLRGVDSKFRLVYHMGEKRDTLTRAARRIARRPAMRRRGAVEGHVGRYVATIGDDEVRFAIDAHDARDVRDEEALGWSDLYFKANRWPDVDYDPRVLPIVNGNGLLDRGRLAFLRGLRDVERDVDVAFISNFRPGRAHMLRLFEELAGLAVDHDLLAVVDGVDKADDARYTPALARAGVTVATRPIPPESLWPRLARAKIVILRAGRHGCWPWRTIDLLCLGACVVVDATPQPTWPTPLLAGRQFAECAIERPPDGEIAAASEYAKLASTVTALLEQPEAAGRLRAAAAAYFDAHAAPHCVAEYLMDTCAACCRSGEGRTE